MSRLIDEAELKEWVENWFYQNKYYHPYSKSNDIPCNELYDILERMPTIDAVEVKHGEWLRYGEDGNPNSIDTCIWQCDQCLETYYGRTTRIAKYCPNCGAKMDATQSNDSNVLDALDGKE